MNSKRKFIKRDQPEQGPAPYLSAGRLRLFRWVSVLALPVVLLLATELGLRILGWKYPTHFFVPSADAPGLLTENQKFGLRFFPRRLAREPDPIRLYRTKPPNTCRIFVFGESAALGDPAPAYSFSRILRELLAARCPGVNFEVINTGMTAINSHAILPIARDCVPLQGDVWIIYMGNNEVVGPFGAGSVFGAQSPPLPVIRAGLAARRTAVGQMLDTIWQRLATHSSQPAHWQGMKMMLNEQIRAADPILDRVYGHFARNLNDIISAAARSGAKPIVCSVSSNLKDCAPFASLNQPDLSSPRKAQWEAFFKSGAALESKREYTNALACYRQAADIDNSYASLVFTMARCCLAEDQVAAARDQYFRARDLDALRFRSDTSINRIIHEVSISRSAEGVTFFDSESMLTNSCKQGIPGGECFWDHVHFNFLGNYCVARGLAERVISLLPELTRRSSESGGTILTGAQCAERLAYTDWDQRSVLGEMLRRAQDPPFTAQLDHENTIRRWTNSAAELDKKLDAAGLAKAVGIYQQALARRPDDWVLHYRLGLLLDKTDDLSGATQHWQAVLQMIPESVETCFKLGEICARQGKPIEAELYYRRVLTLRPTSFEAMNGLGLLLMDKGNLEEAIQFFQQALKINSDFDKVHINWGLLESKRGRPAAAEFHFREALRCDPESSAAHIDLGNLLAAQQKHPEAIDHYLQALKFGANEATVHLALADSLAAIGRGPEAVVQYQAAVRFNPTLTEAHFNLGVALAKLGNLSAAATSFQEACRLNPGDPQAHLNLGVALAQQHQWHEAIVHFQEVIRLDPSNAAARQYLQTAIAREQPGP